jgi:2-haloacid dehalogenase
MLDCSRFSYLTFDCYGTLIDWETGILGALRPLLAAHMRDLPTDNNILDLYAGFESEIEAGPYREYRKVLEQVVEKFAARLVFMPTTAEKTRLAESVKEWPPFPDTVAALQRLGTRYKLVVISNIDDDLFAGSAVKLQANFADVITAQQARSYKPSRNNFRLALQRLAVSQDKVLHVAQSIYHDVLPAKELGLSTVWVNRRKGKAGFGATPPAQAAADLEVPDLATLAELAGV